MSAVPEWKIVKLSLFYFCCIGFVIVQLSPEFTLVKLDRVVHLMEPGNEAGLLPPNGVGGRDFK